MGAHAHAAHLKVEPLVMVITVDVRIQDQVVLKSVGGGARQLNPMGYNINNQQNCCGEFRFERVFFLNAAANTYFLT